MSKVALTLLLAAACSVAFAAEYDLKANSSTVHWGFFYDGLKPQLTVKSGDTVNIEMITHHAGDDFERMIKGDPGIEDIYSWTSTGQNEFMRGANGNGDGVHILTGPIVVEGAEPGDVLQIDILGLEPRPNPSTGKTFGSNAAAWWGYQFRAGFLDGDKREVITIYEVTEENGEYYVQPEYQFRFAGGETGYPGPTTPCAALQGTMPGTLTGVNFEWSNSNSTFSGAEVPCINGTQTWEQYYYPGIITQHPTGTEDYSIKGKFKLGANFHIGNIGLAPAYNTTVDSVPPMVSGGNMDNRRVGIGATLFLPVQVAGAYLSAGDAHAAQGDSELDGTGIETSINGKLKLTLHKKDDLPEIVKNLNYPLIEREDSWIVQGYTYANYLEELDNPMSTIYSESTLDKAMTVCYNNTRDWLMQTTGMTEDQVITAITVGVDFGITQVVDGNWGVHASIKKSDFGLPSVGAASASAASADGMSSTPVTNGSATNMSVIATSAVGAGE